MVEVVAANGVEAAESMVRGIVQQAKDIAIDEAMARCIVVLSDATLVHALSRDDDDEARRTLLNVDSLTNDEANQFVEQSQLPWSASFRNRFFNEIGTRPADFQHAEALRTLAELDDYVARRNGQACNVMSVWTNDSSTHSLLRRIAVANGASVNLRQHNTPDIMPDDLVRLIKSKGHLVTYDGISVKAHSRATLRAIQCWHLEKDCDNFKSNCNN